MASIERILVPTDFSPGSHAALGYAAVFAARFGAVIEVLHVQDEADNPQAAASQEAETQRERTESQMDRFLLGTPGLEGVKMVRRLRAGNPADAILALAEKERFDLIVLGTRGRTGLKRLVLGSVAEKVMREATCPVLTVRVPAP
jgi:nucleotide-binding universal stress UspA family protein